MANKIIVLLLAGTISFSFFFWLFSSISPVTKPSNTIEVILT